MKQSITAILFVLLTCSIGLSETAEEAGVRVGTQHYGGDGVDVGKAWVVTNAAETPLVVKGLRFNGEFDARLGKETRALWLALDTKNKLPMKITIGEHLAFIEYIHMNTGKKSPESYKKEVIFVDVITDRGTFRVRPLPK